jgi:hypothetical protein
LGLVLDSPEIAPVGDTVTSTVSFAATGPAYVPTMALISGAESYSWLY